MERKIEIYNILRDKGYRITNQKKIILDILLDNIDRILSVQDILKSIPENMNIDNATVYRNVRKYVEIGILETMIDDKGLSRYMIYNGTHHHHLICTECGRIINFPCGNRFWETLVKENSFEESYHRLEVYGKCNNCKMRA